MVQLSKTLCWISHFQFGQVFIKVYIFVIIPFKLKIIEKPETVLLLDLCF